MPPIHKTRVHLNFTPPRGTWHIIQAIEFHDYRYYLQCQITGKYMGRTKYSTFLVRSWRDTLARDVTPLMFTTRDEAMQCAQSQTNTQRQHLVPMPIGWFLQQYILGMSIGVNCDFEDNQVLDY